MERNSTKLNTIFSRKVMLPRELSLWKNFRKLENNLNIMITLKINNLQLQLTLINKEMLLGNLILMLNFHKTLEVECLNSYYQFLVFLEF